MKKKIVENDQLDECADYAIDVAYEFSENLEERYVKDSEKLEFIADEEYLFNLNYFFLCSFIQSVIQSTTETIFLGNEETESLKQQKIDFAKMFLYTVCTGVSRTLYKEETTND